MYIKAKPQAQHQSAASKSQTLLHKHWSNAQHFKLMLGLDIEELEVHPEIH